MGEIDCIICVYMACFIFLGHFLKTLWLDCIFGDISFVIV